MTLPLHSPAPTLDQVFTRYAYNKIGGRKYKDQRYKRRPLLRLLRDHKKSGGGGQSIVHPINLGTAFNGKSLGRNETFKISGASNETWSKYVWSVIVETVFVSFWDVRETNGDKFKMQSVLDSRIEETGENIEDNILSQICRTTKSKTADLNTLRSIVATSGETGGLNPSTAGQADWAAQVEDTISWSVAGLGRSRKLIQKITDRKGNPDVILLPDEFFNETCEIGDGILRINQDASTRGGTKYADLGLRVPFILDTPLIHDSAWNAEQPNTGVVLDLDCVHLCVDPKWDMYMYPFKEMAHNGRLGQASVKLGVSQLTCSGRRANGLLSTIS